MELYELHLHFPGIYGSLDGEPLELTSSDYYNTDAEAVCRAQVVASAFVSPKPDFWWLVGFAGDAVWTNDLEATKQVLHYDILAVKPMINEVTQDY